MKDFGLDAVHSAHEPRRFEAHPLTCKLQEGLHGLVRFITRLSLHGQGNLSVVVRRGPIPIDEESELARGRSNAQPHFVL